VRVGVAEEVEEKVWLAVSVVEPLGETDRVAVGVEVGVVV
jgi:hypothetical protein